tara:strand:+ start:145762 stop:146352 length:591 start_codon:yes stop_codon:yes gene_type:complete
MTELQLAYGEGDIQELGHLILENKLYIDEKSLNYVMASRADRPKEDYRRYLHYVTLTLDNRIIGLCMLVEQIVGHVHEDDLHYYSDAFYSAYVLPEHRKQGYAEMMTEELGERLECYFEERSERYNRYSVMADPNGAPIARKYFTAPVVCGGFPTSKGIRRVAARLHNKPFDEDCQLDPEFAHTVDSYDVLAAQYA